VNDHAQSNEPGVDFSTFVLSLSHSALVQLGDAPHPDTQKIEPDLEAARHTIDLLTMMEEKTKGNLTGEEERLLAQLLFDLRMRCVTKEKGK
jgi:hypothetical protein